MLTLGIKAIHKILWYVMNTVNYIRSRINFRIPLILITVQILFAYCNEKKIPHEFFPYTEPERVDVSSDSLRVIVNQLKVWVESGDIVGAELLIIKKKRTIFHEAIGWINLENKVPMKRNTIFNIRSMTKPLVGTAIFMLFEQGNLTLNDKVMKYIPIFDNEKCRDITIDHLLMHIAGFRSSQEIGIKYKNLEEIVIESSKLGPMFLPGSRLYYSGRNSAILTFIIETIIDTRAEVWIKRNILDPLDMKDTFCVHHQICSNTILKRISHVYVLKDNNYEKYWDPSWKPEFPYFGGGVGFYSTVRDYAKFLSMWMDWGISEKKFLKNPSTVKLAFQSNPFDPTCARHWEIFKPSPENEETLPAFGHIGDFGTMAYAVPESDLIICFFTQSRYNKIMGEFLTLVERALY
jgi:CubicO group peptidase (beta-lactamase class C family)